MTQGITFMGEDLEQNIIHLLPNSYKGPQAICDVIWESELGKINIEIKDGQPNQTRPYKKNILIVHNKKDHLFYVIPASVVITSVLHRKGQHALDPMCCCKPSMGKVYEPYICTFDEIPDKILEAYQHDNHAQNDSIWKFVNKRIEEWNRHLRENKDFQERIQILQSASNIDRFGEVMTPMNLVQEILDKIPQDVWQNPNYKWIDNSCGSGNFLVEILNRLSKYHSKEHILSHMIYGVDIQKDKVQETLRRLGGGNVVCSDALTFDYWGGLKFDIIVGNPPYNAPKKGKKGNNCNPLWTKFVQHIHEHLCRENGYVTLIHPPLWRKPQHKIGKLLRSKQIRYLKMYDVEATKKIFGVDVKVDYYLLRNSSPSGWTTSVIDERGNEIEIDLSDKVFIPNHSFSDSYDVFGGRRKVLYSCCYHHYTQKNTGRMSKIKDDIYYLPCVYLVNKKGIQYYYSKEDVGHFGIPKVIISMGRFEPIKDVEGKYGMCEVAFGLPVQDEAEANRMISYFSTDKFQNVLSACKWKTVQLDYRLFQYLKEI